MNEYYNEQFQPEQEFGGAAPQAAPKRNKLLLLIPVVAAVIILAVVGSLIYNAVTNTWKTPLKLQEEYWNAKSYSEQMDVSLKSTNGLFDKELKKMYNILKKSDDFEEYFDYLEENFEDRIDNWKDKYGSNYKFYIEVEDKDKLDKDDLKDIKDDFKDFAEEIEEMLEEYDDYDSDDWEEEAEDMGISKSDLKELVDIMRSIHKKINSAKVSAGYDLEINLMVKGKELDEPEEYWEDEEITVCKVNGKWVCLDDLEILEFFM